MPDQGGHDLIREALRLLGKRRLMLSIHDGSFPGDEDEDLGRGSPHSRGGRRFMAFAGELGFTGLQVGPQGLTSRGNPSPYDGTAFSKNTLSIAFGPLVESDGLLKDAEVAREIRRLSSRRFRSRHFALVVSTAHLTRSVRASSSNSRCRLPPPQQRSGDSRSESER